MRLPLAILLGVSLLLVFGCAQPTPPQQCLNGSSANLSKCIYRTAVLGQEPYTCYSLREQQQRIDCLRDSTDPSAKKNLDRTVEQERAPVIVPPKTQNITVEPALPTEPEPEPLPPGYESCNSLRGDDRDLCILSISVNKFNLRACERIVDSTFRNSCISQIAMRTKNITTCESLSTVNNQELCRSYAQG